MANTFSVTFRGPAVGTLGKAKTAILKGGGTFNGDERKGDFIVNTPAGKVKGNYTIVGQVFTLNITDKPFIVPLSVIESQVREFIGAD